MPLLMDRYQPLRQTDLSTDTSGGFLNFFGARQYSFLLYTNIFIVNTKDRKHCFRSFVFCITPNIEGIRNFF